MVDSLTVVAYVDLTHNDNWKVRIDRPRGALGWDGMGMGLGMGMRMGMGMGMGIAGYGDGDGDGVGDGAGDGQLLSDE